MAHKIYIILLAGFLFSSQVFAGGPWPQKKGHGFYKLSLWWVIADAHYTDTGEIDPNVTNGIFNTSIYAEYGITDRITGVVYMPIYSRAYFNNLVSGTTNDIIKPGEAINSIGDADVGITYGIIKDKRIVLSATAKLGLPLGTDDGGSEANLQTGDGEFNQILRMDVGTSFKIKKASFYASAYAGFNNRSNGFSDEIRYGLEVGNIALKEKLITTVRLTGIESLQNGLSQAPINSTSLFANNSEHLSTSIEVGYTFTEKLGASVSYGTALRGKLIFADPAYSVGLYLKL